MGEEEFETETCAGCGLTVDVDSPVFLEWDADIVGYSLCPDCRADETPSTEADETPRRRAA